MINDILTAAGLPYKKTRFTKPPKTAYAIYLEDIDTDGADYMNQIRTYDYTVELYQYSPDDAVEERLETVLDARGIRWTKQGRAWLQSEQLYQAVYDFQIIEKRRL